MQTHDLARLGRDLRSFTSMMLILFLCFGCAGSGAVGKGAVGEPQTSAPPKSPVAAGPKAPEVMGKDLLQGVQVQDRAGKEITVSATGSVPLQDYQFKRLGEDRFALELGNIGNMTSLPPLPPSTQRLTLSYSDVAPDVVQIVGVLSSPLDRYVLNTSGNSLMLVLYTVDQTAGAAPDEERVLKVVESAASKKQKTKNPTPVPIKTAPREQKSAQAQASQPAAQPASRFSAAMQKAKYTGKPISLDLLDADLRNVLRLLADLSGNNIAIEPDVTGKVTLKVEQVPWDQVLDMVLAMNDLGKEQLGNVIRIARQGKLKQEWDQQTSEIKAKQDLMEVSKDVGEISTVYLSVNYAQLADMAGKINEMKSPKGKVQLDERTGLIIYSDFPARIESARQLLAKLDKATPQVLIEARIITTTTDISRSLGINWSFSAAHVNSTNANTPTTQQFQVNSPPADLFTFALAEIVGQTLINVDLRLSALETANEVKVMAAPKLLTINNVKAIITQGTQIPYPKLNEFGVTSTEFKDAVLELQVTPHITPDHKVRLEVKAKQDEPNLTLLGASTTEPAIDTRKIETELLVDNGAIIVIGGVIRNRDEKTLTATPGLHRVPILGRLFKTESAASSRTELLIFISPRIVESHGLPL